MNDKELYLKNGYLNMKGLIDSKSPFVFVTAGRGTGKTYGALTETYKATANGEPPVLLLRRSQVEADMQACKAMCAYKSVLDDLHVDFTIEKMGKNLAVVKREPDKMEIAYIAALSTFSNIRGVDFSNIKTVIYDEFIPERQSAKIKNEGMIFANFYETVNRNRELNGKEPLKVLFLANAFNLSNPIFEYFDMLETAEEMLMNDEEIRETETKTLIIPQHSPISKRKAETALYKAVKEEFKELAIDNSFVLNDFTYVNRSKLREYSIICKIGKITIYRHKNNKTYYITKTEGTPKEIFSDGSADLQRARRKYMNIRIAFMEGRCYFENFSCQTYFCNYFNINI